MTTTRVTYDSLKGLIVHSDPDVSGSSLPAGSHRGGGTSGPGDLDLRGELFGHKKAITTIGDSDITSTLVPSNGVLNYSTAPSAARVINLPALGGLSPEGEIRLTGGLAAGDMIIIQNVFGSTETTSSVQLLMVANGGLANGTRCNAVGGADAAGLFYAVRIGAGPSALQGIDNLDTVLTGQAAPLFTGLTAYGTAVRTQQPTTSRLVLSVPNTLLSTATNAGVIFEGVDSGAVIFTTSPAGGAAPNRDLDGHVVEVKVGAIFDGAFNAVIQLPSGSLSGEKQASFVGHILNGQGDSAAAPFSDSAVVGDVQIILSGAIAGNNGALPGDWVRLVASSMSGSTTGAVWYVQGMCKNNLVGTGGDTQGISFA